MKDMFSGIIDELGLVRNLYRRGNVTVLEVEADKIVEGTHVGESISVNGVCLTVIEKEKKALSFEAISQTLKVTNLGSLRVSEQVNLERSLRIGDRLSGHFVTGHIDCIGIIRNKFYQNNSLRFQISVPSEFMKHCLPRGSVAVDGISLTLADVKSNTFSVYLIPHTLQNTTLGFKGPSDKVNIEFDILTKR